MERKIRDGYDLADKRRKEFPTMVEIRQLKREDWHNLKPPYPELFFPTVKNSKGEPKKNWSSFRATWLSDFLRERHRFITIEDQNKDMFVYDEKEGTYLGDGDLFLRQKVKEWLDDHSTPRYFRQVEFDVQTETFVKREDFYLEPNLIPVKNGILDFETKLLIENSPDYFVTNRIDAKYVPEADCPKIKQFLKEIQPDFENLKLIQEYIGYCLWREFPFDLVLMLLGDGNNGKSTFIQLIETLLGEGNVAHVPVHELCNEQWAVADIYLKLANIVADIEEKELKHTRQFLAVTGGDRVRAQRKYGHPFDFRPYTKHIFSANRMPYSYNDTDAWYRRWVIIPFTQVFLEGDSKTDPFIIEKLTTPEELSGFFNWALEGLERLFKQKKFCNVPSIEERRILWHRMSDPVRAFLNSEYIEWNPSYKITKEEFNKNLYKYCVSEGLPTWTPEKIGRWINKMCPSMMDTTMLIDVPDGAKQVSAWGGIRLKPMEEPENVDAIFEALMENED